MKRQIATEAIEAISEIVHKQDDNSLFSNFVNSLKTAMTFDTKEDWLNVKEYIKSYKLNPHLYRTTCGGDKLCCKEVNR